MTLSHGWFSDTDPDALALLLRLQREMPPAEKLRSVFQLNEMVTRMVEAGLRRQYPGATDREIFLRAAARRLGRDTVRRVYGWDPEP